MATIRHPVTGVVLNDMPIRRNRLSEDEMRTARLLMAEGDPRWLAAAKLGAHALAINVQNVPRNDRRKPIGHELRASDARRDPRQAAMDDLLGSPDTAEPRNGTDAT